MIHHLSRKDRSIDSYNVALKEMKEDCLYHLGLDTSMDLKKSFGDVKFVVMGGSASRAEHLAEEFFGVFYPSLSSGIGVKYVGKTERYSLFKVGPVISVSHGMGAPSISILLNEVYKLLIYAGAVDFSFIRVGTCGGIGIAPGTVVITSQNLNGELQPYHELPVLGVMKKFSTEVDLSFPNEILEFSKTTDFSCVMGITMSTNDFYEGQGRLDGATCEYSKVDRANFIEKLHSMGVTNIEMEGVQFHAFCNRVNIPCAMLCSVLVDRTKGDQVSVGHELLSKYSNNSQGLCVAFIKDRCEGSIM